MRESQWHEKKTRLQELSSLLSSVDHTAPDIFENGVFSLKLHQIFSVHTTPEKFKNATITGHFGFVFEENSCREIT